MSEYDDDNCLDIVYNAKAIFIEKSILTSMYIFYQHKVISINADILQTNNGYLKKYMK